MQQIPNMTTRLAVLSRGPRLYSTRRLVEARLREIDVAVINPMQFSLFVAEQDIGILHQGQKFDYDAVIPRIGHSITKHGVAVLRHLEQLDVWTANTSQVFYRVVTSYTLHKFWQEIESQHRALHTCAT